MSRSRMEVIKLSLVAITFLVSGCTVKPTVYVYAKYLEDSKKVELQNKLEADKYQVQLNELDFPTTITENTIIYSPLLSQAEAIDGVADVAKDLGLPVQNIQGLTSGNHWYKQNSLALFVFSEGSTSKRGMLRQDLVKDYQSESCGKELILSLKKDGTFLLKSNGGKINDGIEQEGQWLYRQYPYLELTSKGSSYASYYFELTQYKSQDQVSEIEFIKLNLLNSGAGAISGKCAFLYGTRV